MGAEAMARDEDGIEVQYYPPQKKPKPRSNPYPHSGGKVAQLPDYSRSRGERGPVMKLLKMSPGGGMVISGSSGPVRLTQYDVAAALGMKSPTSYRVGDDGIDHELSKLSLGSYYFARVKYLQEKESLPQLKSSVHCAAIDMAMSHGWKVVRGKAIFRNAGLLALARHVDTDGLMYCPDCQGRGTTKRNNTCKSCRGSGDKPLSERALADMIGTDHKGYKRIWRARIDMIYRMLCGWDQEVMQHLYWQFAGGAGHE